MSLIAACQSAADACRESAQRIQAVTDCLARKPALTEADHKAIGDLAVAKSDLVKSVDYLEDAICPLCGGFGEPDDI